MFQNWHILNGSFLPLSMSFLIFNLLSGFFFWLKFSFFFDLIFGLLMIIVLVLFWMKDVFFESFSGNHNFFIEDGFKTFFFLFLFSEVMFFFSVFWLFFDASISTHFFIGDVWPSLGIIVVNPFGVPLLNTILLLSSAVSLTWSHFFLISNKDCIKSLVLTIFLGFLFLIVQLKEYSITMFSFSDSFFGSIFFFGTGFHGLHVFFGMLFLLLNLYRLNNFNFSFFFHLGFEMSIIYWHFVDVVWLFLFVFVYWWSN